MDKKIYRFSAVLQKVPDIDGAYIEIPFDVKKEFGNSRVKVHAEFDGVTYDGSLSHYWCTQGHSAEVAKSSR